MNKDHRESSDNHSGQLQIGFCHNCNQIHLRATNVMLDFSKREFLNFSNANLGILREEFTAEELKSIPNFNANTDDILLAETVA